MSKQIEGMYKKTGMFGRKNKQHNGHIDSSREVLRTYMVGDRNHVINIDGQRAGLLSMTVPTSGHVRIEGVASLPGTKGVGRAAVEHAIRLSMSSGLEGRVDLRYLPGYPRSRSREIYKGYGFIDASSIVRDSQGREARDNRMTLSESAARKFLAESDGRPPSFV